MPVIVRIVACALLALACATGCASSREPSVSGVGLFDNRNVSLGDVVEIRLPAGPDGRRAWRVTSYDSAILMPEGRAGLERAGDDLVYVMRFRAQVRGETEVTVTPGDYGSRDSG